MAFLIQWGSAHLKRRMNRFGPWGSALLMVRLASLIVALHTLQILLWAGFYRRSCFPTWESALYFSAASYSTVGYGDVLLRGAWRTLGPAESVTGVLMCGVSASFMFAIVTRLIEREARFSPELASLTGGRPTTPVPSAYPKNGGPHV
jgi:hypothetical protein